MKKITGKYVEQEQFIRDNYPTKGGKYCADTLGEDFTDKGIRYFAWSKGIKRIKTLSHDISLFKNPSTPQMVYYLGLVWGDGTVTDGCVRIGVESEDGINFHNTFKDLANFGTYTHPSRASNLKPIMTIALYGKELCEYFISMDYRIKSRVSPTKILNTIPDDLKRFFWLGFLDADGCIYTRGNKCEVSFSGHGQQEWTDLINFIENMRCKAIFKMNRGEKGESSCVKINSRFDCNHFLTYLYQSYEVDGIGLERKYVKFLESRSLFSNQRQSSIGYAGVRSTKTKKLIKFRVYFRGNKDFILKDGFSTPEDAAVFFDKLSVSLFGHRAFTNFPITNYIDLGNPSYEIPVYPELDDLIWIRSKEKFNTSILEF